MAINKKPLNFPGKGVGEPPLDISKLIHVNFTEVGEPLDLSEIKTLEFPEQEELVLTANDEVVNAK